MDINLNEKKFKSVSSTGNAEVSSSTIFHYRQKNSIVWATYEGGAILFGTLSGRLIETQLTFTYQHQNLAGEFMTGKCESIVELRKEKIILKERWQWTSGDYSEGESTLEEIV